MHSDPTSRDSIVFCEECKIETRNKELVESKVVLLIYDKFMVAKTAARECLAMANQK